MSVFLQNFTLCCPFSGCWQTQWKWHEHVYNHEEGWTAFYLFKYLCIPFYLFSVVCFCELPIHVLCHKNFGKKVKKKILANRVLSFSHWKKITIMYYILCIIIYVTYYNMICALYLSLKLYIFSHFRKIRLSILRTIFFCSSHNLNVYIAKCVIF